MTKEHLSVLKNAGENSITYYVGDNVEHVNHLKNCKLICKNGFKPELNNVEIIHTDDPQLYFYRLSKKYKEDYLDNKNLIWDDKYRCYIHKDAKIGNNVRIGVGSVIGNSTIGDNTEIHSNVVIYAKTNIGKNCIIQSNTTLGCTGAMWVWDKEDRVYLEQLGDLVIEDNVRIGSQCVIARGNANESTLIKTGTIISHGSLIGHGNIVGKYVHMANGVKLGGGCVIGDKNFLGSGAVVSAGVKLLSKNIVLGAGTVVVKDLTQEGIYFGVPAKRSGDIKENMKGLPIWR